MSAANPIISGFAPDPSITRIDDTFFLVNSSFHVFPGLPIYASKDLRTWKHIGNAINRVGQLSLSESTTLAHGLDDPKADKIVGSGGLYAPTIRHHNGKTYIVCTNVRHVKSEEGNYSVDFRNFVISTEDIWASDWSDPIYFNMHGIDPDLFFDDDGRVYVSGSSWNTTPSTIVCFEVDLTTGTKMTPERTIWEGFSKIIPEGPHMYKRGDWYYLLDAEGGTHEGHRIAMARSRNVFGPYEGCPENPVLRPGSDYIQYNGHGDLFQDTSGRWWLVCLAARVDRDGRCGLSRETFLTSVTWTSTDSWPLISQPITTLLPSNMPSANPLSYHVDPKIELLWIRNPDLTAYRVSEDARELELLPSMDDLHEGNSRFISFVGKRQRSLIGQATVTLPLHNGSTRSATPLGIKAGLAYYKDEHRFARVYYDFSSSSVWFEMKNSGRRPGIALKAEATKLPGGFEGQESLRFRISYSETKLELKYSSDQDSQENWITVGIVDILDLTDRDFTGPCLGVFATKQSEASSLSDIPDENFRVVFTHFEVL